MVVLKDESLPQTFHNSSPKPFIGLADWILLNQHLSPLV